MLRQQMFVSIRCEQSKTNLIHQKIIVKIFYERNRQIMLMAALNFHI
jgi:hypothetical protein